MTCRKYLPEGFFLRIKHRPLPVSHHKTPGPGSAQFSLELLWYSVLEKLQAQSSQTKCLPVCCLWLDTEYFCSISCFLWAPPPPPPVDFRDLKWRARNLSINHDLGFRYLHIWAWLIMDYTTIQQDGHWKCILFSNMFLCGEIREEQRIATNF